MLIRLRTRGLTRIRALVLCLGLAFSAVAKTKVEAEQQADSSSSETKGQADVASEWIQGAWLFGAAVVGLLGVARYRNLG